VGGVALDRLSMGLQSLIGTAQIEQRISTVGGSAPAAQRLGPLEDLDRFGKAALGMKQNAMHVHGFVVAGIELESPA